VNDKTIKDTGAWQQLEHGFSSNDADIATALAANLIAICDTELSSRLKAIPTLMPEYTLHDEVHSLRVTSLMWRLMPARVRRLLNPIEIALLIFAAYAHDQGMVMEKDELRALTSDAAFLLFQENWQIEHPNVTLNQHRLDDSTLVAGERAHAALIAQELHGAMLTDYIRRTHGERSARFFRAEYGDDERLRVNGTGLAEFVARLCLSHVESADRLTPSNGFRCDERIGTYSVNMVYLAAVLRLADIMDFDRERTPDGLYRTINFRSGVSLVEWNKHRSVDGWVISADEIQFTMRCEHPEYQRAAYQFMDWIDQELASVQNLISTFPQAVSQYGLDLPLRVDRSRIEPKDNAYIYRDLEFSLSRDEIVSLLMTEKLYGGPALCVRELLQNSLDALRYRRAVMRRDGVSWVSGRVELSHELDADGFEILRCSDNGIGMTEEVVTRFLTRAGRSYYRSPEFERERATFVQVGADFDPCARFGIGFMSVFMVGDEITIHTRRDYGPSGGYGVPLVVEVNGLGGIVVIRSGPASQLPGTSVEIRRRSRTSIIDARDDDVRLIPMLEGYALVTEFPIYGVCTIPGITESSTIPADFAAPPTELEELAIRGIRTFEKRFDSVAPDLNGIVRVSFIVDSRKRLVRGNDELAWQKDGYFWKLYAADGTKLESYPARQIAVDGILVSGRPGRADKNCDTRYLGYSSSQFELGRSAFLLDARGAQKPLLTPSREARPFASRYEPTWRRLRQAAYVAWGEIWEEIAALAPKFIDDETFWFVADVYEAGVLDMRVSRLWSTIKVPIIRRGDRRLRTVKLEEIKEFEVTEVEHSRIDTERQVNVAEGCVGLRGEVISQVLNEALIASACVSLRRSECVLIPNNDWRMNGRLRDGVDDGGDGTIYKLPYRGVLRKVLSVSHTVRTLNRDHAITRALAEARDSKTALGEFIVSLAELVTNENFQSWLKEPNEVSAATRRVGRLYQRVAWNTVNPDLKPPYGLYLGDSVISISEPDFANWASALAKER
jgi:hypothetical protein